MKTDFYGKALDTRRKPKRAEQPDMFAEPLSRKTDPITSREATTAERVTGQRLRVLKESEVFGKDFTAKELSALSGIPHNVICRRLPELKKLGKLNKCESDDPNPLRRNGEMVWWVV